MSEPRFINEEALTAAHLAVENMLIDLRDSRIGVLGRANGFVVNEADGTLSNIMRLGTRDGLRIAITAYLDTLEPKVPDWKRPMFDRLDTPVTEEMEKLGKSDDPLDQAIAELWRGRSIVS